MRAPSHALVLTAGLGMRLRPLTAVRAKPAIPVAGEPMVRRIVAWLASTGVTDLVLNLHHLPETLTAIVGDGSDLSARVRYSWEQPVVLGSAGGPRQALPIIGADTFLLVNGDTLTDVDLGALAASHADSRALVTLALVPNREPDRYGGVRLDREARVVGFSRRGSDAAGSYHFIGVQIVSAQTFSRLAQGQPAQSVGGLYDELVASQPGTLRGHVCDARFWDVGTAADYLRTSRAFALAEGREDTWGRGTRVAPDADTAGSILWDDVDIGPGAIVADCIVADGVRVAAGAVYRHAVLVRADRHRAAPGQHIDGDVLVSPMALT